MAEVDYLGHVVLRNGLKAGPKKTIAMLEWSEPNNLKALRGFLSLISYYRKSIKEYGLIATLLTTLLKKSAFNWFEVVFKSF